MRRNKHAPVSKWATIGTRLTFRAEVMPGRASGERTFTVARVHASGRVELTELFGQHAETEFEPLCVEGSATQAAQAFPREII